MATGPSDNQEGSSGATSLSLLERAKGQDEAAWNRLVSLYTPLVEGWCRLAGLRGADVEDVCQDVFLAVNRGLANFHRDRAGDTFRGWLRTITRRKACDHRAKALAAAIGAGGSDAQQRFLQLPAEEPPGSDEAAASDEVTRLFRRALALVRGDFGEQTWQAFWRVAVEGQPSPEVAAALHMTVNAVYLAKARVVARLREEFGDVLDE